MIKFFFRFIMEKAPTDKVGAFHIQFTNQFDLLLRTKDPVSRITQIRANAGVRIQVAVQMSDIDLNIGMILVRTF